MGVVAATTVGPEVLLTLTNQLTALARTLKFTELISCVRQIKALNSIFMIHFIGFNRGPDGSPVTFLSRGENLGFFFTLNFLNLSGS